MPNVSPLPPKMKPKYSKISIYLVILTAAKIAFYSLSNPAGILDNDNTFCNKREVKTTDTQMARGRTDPYLTICVKVARFCTESIRQLSASPCLCIKNKD